MLADSPCRTTACANKTFSVGIATRVPQMMWTKLTKAVFCQRCYISRIQYFRTRQHFFFPSPPSLLLFLSLPGVFPHHFLCSREETTDKPKPNPLQCNHPGSRIQLTTDTYFQLCIKGTEIFCHFMQLVWSMLLPRAIQIVLKLVIFAFQKRNTLPKESKCRHLTFSAFGFSVYVTWPDRSGEEKT